MLFAKLAIAAGGILIFAYFLGAIWFEPATMIGALAAILGGLVILGSNSSTSKQITAALKAADIRRGELIDVFNTLAVSARDGLNIGSSAPFDPTTLIGAIVCGRFCAIENGVKALTHKRSLAFHGPNMLRARLAFFGRRYRRFWAGRLADKLEASLRILGNAREEA